MTETRAPTDYVKLLEDYAKGCSDAATGEKYRGIAGQCEADAAALRQLAELLPELLRDQELLDQLERFMLQDPHFNKVTVETDPLNDRWREFTVWQSGDDNGGIYRRGMGRHLRAAITDAALAEPSHD